MFFARDPQLGFSAGDAVNLVSKIGSYADTLVLIVNDPALPQFMQRIETLHDVETSRAQATAVQQNQTPPTKDKVGVGLGRLIAPLDALIFFRRNPIAGWAIAASAVLLIGGAGYRLAQRRTMR